MTNDREKGKFAEIFPENVDWERVKKVILVAVFGFLVLAGLTLKASSYAEKPEFCKSCHSMKYYYNTWSDSSHKEVTCFDCHVGYTPVKKVEPMPVTNQKYWALTYGGSTVNVSKYMNKVKETVVVVNRHIDNFNRQANFVIARSQDIKKFFSVVSGSSGKDGIAPMWENCLNCHKDLITPASKTDNSGHSKHLQNGLNCDQCHQTVIHGKGSTMPRNQCMTCHDGKLPKPASHKTSKFKNSHGKSYLTRQGCTICHVQGAREKVCMECHGIEMPHPEEYPRIHVQNIKPVGIKKCMNCHEDNQKKAGQKMATKSCSSCHGSAMPHKGYFKIVKTHGSLAVKNGTRSCYSCHNQSICTDCHGGVPMPHPKNILPQHPSLAKSIGLDKCSSCHEGKGGKAQECKSCHNVDIPHPPDWRANHAGEKEACVICHSSKNPANPNAPWAKENFCQKCHYLQPGHHEDAPDCRKCHTYQTCIKCHDDPNKIVM